MFHKFQDSSGSKCASNSMDPVLDPVFVFFDFKCVQFSSIVSKSLRQVDMYEVNGLGWWQNIFLKMSNSTNINQPSNGV